MRGRILSVAVVLALAGCASAGSTSSTTGAKPVSATPPGSTAGEWAVSIVGTPFMFVFRTAVCGASVVLAAPTAAFLSLGLDPSGEAMHTLGKGVATNCSPPYVLTPNSVS